MNQLKQLNKIKYGAAFRDSVVFHVNFDDDNDQTHEVMPDVTLHVVKRTGIDVDPSKLLGLKWSKIHKPPDGSLALDNADLANALQGEYTRFTTKQWASFEVKNLNEKHYVQKGDIYFQPVSGYDCIYKFDNHWIFIDIVSTNHSIREVFVESIPNTNTNTVKLKVQFLKEPNTPISNTHLPAPNPGVVLPKRLQF